MPSVWRASTSTAARRSVPTAWPAAAATKSSMPVEVEARSAGRRVTPGSRRRSGSAVAQRLAGVGRRRPVRRDDRGRCSGAWSRTSWSRRSMVGRRAQWRSSSTSSTGCARASSASAAMTAPNRRHPLGIGVAVADRHRQPEVGGPAGHEPGQFGRRAAEAADRRRPDRRRRAPGRAPRRTAGTAPSAPPSTCRRAPRRRRRGRGGRTPSAAASCRRPPHPARARPAGHRSPPPPTSAPARPTADARPTSGMAPTSVSSGGSGMGGVGRARSSSVPIGRIVRR